MPAPGSEVTDLTQERSKRMREMLDELPVLGKERAVRMHKPAACGKTEDLASWLLPKRGELLNRVQAQTSQLDPLLVQEVIEGALLAGLGRIERWQAETILTRLNGSGVSRPGRALSKLLRSTASPGSR